MTRYLSLLPLALALSACGTSAYPTSGGGYVAPYVSTYAPPDAQGTLSAAQLQLDASNRATQQAQHATQALATATWQALELRQAETQGAIDVQRQHIEIEQTQFAMTLTREAHDIGIILTTVYLSNVQSVATATAQARADEYAAMMDRRGNERAFGERANNLWAMFYGLLIIAGVGVPAWGVFQAVQRWRFAPYYDRNGNAILQAPPQPVLPEPQQAETMTPETALGLQFLDAALDYQQDNPDFPRSQIPSDGKFKAAGFHMFVTGSGWQNARNKFGALLTSGDSGTFCAEGDVQELRDRVATGKTTLPYPIS